MEAYNKYLEWKYTLIQYSPFPSLCSQSMPATGKYVGYSWICDITMHEPAGEVPSCAGYLFVLLLIQF